MAPLHTPLTAERYNASMHHPTIQAAVRYLMRSSGQFKAQTLIEKLMQLENYPDMSVGDLLGAAQSAGQPLRGASAPIEELHDIPTPFLTYLRRNSGEGSRVDLVQIEQVGPKRAVITSDRFGKVHIPRSELAARWSGIILLAAGEGAGRSGLEISELDYYRSRVEVLPEFLSPRDCDALIELCENACFRRSKVAQSRSNASTDVVATSIRSSTTVILEDRNHPILAGLYARCAALEGVNEHYIEQIQCVRYKRGQRFKSHFDGGPGLPRLTTYLLYLNDDFEGGETYFPMLDLFVAPKKGSCLRFPSCDPEGRVLWPSEHGGLPVASGMKYALNIWVRCPGVPFAGRMPQAPDLETGAEFCQ